MNIITLSNFGPTFLTTIVAGTPQVMYANVKTMTYCNGISSHFIHEASTLSYRNVVFVAFGNVQRLGHALNLRIPLGYGISVCGSARLLF